MTATRGDAYAVAARLVANVEQVVHGRRAQVELVVCAVLAGGHVLAEDVRGTGKTTLARAVARSLGGGFRRVQGTADLLPADITGSGVWEPDPRAGACVAGAAGVLVRAGAAVRQRRPRRRAEPHTAAHSVGVPGGDGRGRGDGGRRAA